MTNNFDINKKKMYFKLLLINVLNLITTKEIEWKMTFANPTKKGMLFIKIDYFGKK